MPVADPLLAARRLGRASKRFARLALGALATSAAAQETPAVAEPAPGARVAVAPAAASSPGSAASAAPLKRSSLALPAVEILGFQVLLNRANRYVGSEHDDYRVTGSSIRDNLHSGWGTDRDPFSVNQLGHPYQGAMYHGFARSTGHDYWESLGYSFAGSAVWEIAGERTKPSRNDQVASGIGGTFLGEALFRMSNLVLEQGGGLPSFWREIAGAAIAPSSGFNRLVYGNGYGSVFSSRDAAYSSRLAFGAAVNLERQLGNSVTDYQKNEAQIDFALDYGLPGQKGYEYTRPFDYFNFQATASSAHGVESVLTRGLLIGTSYEAGPNYRGVWGLYGSYDYLSPQAFRVSTTAVSVGSTAQWWLGPKLSLQGTATGGVGYAAVGTVRGNGNDDRDYNYGVAPQALLALRLTYDEKVSLDATAREYFVSRIASGTEGGHDNILRGDASLTYRVTRQQALTLRVLASRRDASFGGTTPTGRQSQVSLGLFYTLVGKDWFGTVDWR